jgi:uncharacterized protein (DUF1330 family)
MEPIEQVRAVLDQLAAAVPDGQPVVMVNLLRYRERADYPAGTVKEPVTGRQAYEHYSHLTIPHLRKVGGRPIWRADARTTFFAPVGERWDEVILVRYPSRSAFGQMISNPDYQAGTIHRTAALEDSRLIATTAPQGIGRIAWWLFGLTAAARRG